MNYSEIKIETEGSEATVIAFGRGPKNFVILPVASLTTFEGMGFAIATAFSMFEDAYSCYLIDRPIRMQEDSSVDSMAEEVYKILQSLDIDKTCVFGASMGGMIAMSLAMNHPEIVESMVLGSTAARVRESSQDTLKELLKIIESNDRVGLNNHFAKLIYTDEYRKEYAEVFKAMENNGTPEELYRLALQLKAVLNYNCIDKLYNINCPVGVIGAVNDRLFPGEIDSKAIAEKVANSQLFLYENHYGHAVYDEAPDYRNKIYNYFATNKLLH